MRRAPQPASHLSSRRDMPARPGSATQRAAAVSTGCVETTARQLDISDEQSRAARAAAGGAAGLAPSCN